MTITHPVSKQLSLDEAPVVTDKDSASTAAFGAFHGYGVSGQVTGQVVYANFGRPEDFEQLEKMGIDVKGKIVLVRYGGLFRGLKVRNAQTRGAAGILIFSDPADDGFAKGDVYPTRPVSAGLRDPARQRAVPFAGARRSVDAVRPLGQGCQAASFRPEERIHPASNRATLSIADWEKETGLKRDEYFATIPSLPLSYEAAHELLKLLAGPNVPSGWQGGLAPGLPRRARPGRGP